jgi:chromosome segregation ATPase
MFLPQDLEMKASIREKALIGILERLADEMKDQDLMLEDLLKHQGELTKATEALDRYQRVKFTDSDKANEKLFDSFHHYRSDMLSLVNEQDRINSNINDLHKALKTATYTLDVTTQKINDLDERLKLHEKASLEHFEHAIKQPEIYSETVIDTTRSFTKLHSDTEKHLSELHRETEQQLNKFQSETTRRLLLLDSITTSLQTLLQRTEPPERKTPWFKRKLDRFFKFVRRKWSLLFKK